MKHKFFRALEYAKQLLLLLFFLPAGFLVKLLCPKFRHVWLVMERGNDARDNGYHFFRYLKTAHPEIRAYYVIDPKSPDRDKIAPLGGLVNYRSLPALSVILRGRIISFPRTFSLVRRI